MLKKVKSYELYNAKKNGKIRQFNEKWQIKKIETKFSQENVTNVFIEQYINDLKTSG